MSEQPRQALLRTNSHCDRHISFHPLCALCRSKLEQGVAEVLITPDSEVTKPPPGVVQIPLPLQPTEQELREFLDRKRDEAAGL
ncbi:MAG: hypothetical protein E6Q76_03710 [Rhizobium sp.]|nr:MAG: hypothetical protein E6Q76_03710 [Rhizobium sp.]